MFRMFTTVAVLALTAGAVQADPLSARIHDAAVVACAPESADSLPASHYAAITEHCIYRVSSAAMAKIRAEAEAKPSSVKLANS